MGVAYGLDTLPDGQGRQSRFRRKDSSEPRRLAPLANHACPLCVSLIDEAPCLLGAPF